MSQGVHALNSSVSCREKAAAKIPRTASKTTRINSTRASPLEAPSYGRFLERSSPLLLLLGSSAAGACLKRQGFRLPICFVATLLPQAERELGRVCRRPVP